MLAMVVNDTAGSLTPHGVLESIASVLAPTKSHALQDSRISTRSRTTSYTQW
jgi:hypothetical protein